MAEAAKPQEKRGVLMSIGDCMESHPCQHLCLVRLPDGTNIEEHPAQKAADAAFAKSMRQQQARATKTKKATR